MNGASPAPRPPAGERPWSLRLDRDQRQVLDGHLLRDGDEHGAVIAAGVTRSERGVRLLAREIFLAEDGVDFVPSKRSYRRLTAAFVNDKIRYCRDHGLAYLAVHNHGGLDSVVFSDDDLRSHERGYPALLDIGRGIPVGALVFAREAVAGDLWTPDRVRRPLVEAVVLGPRLVRLYDRPREQAPGRPEAYDRAARLYGDAGQQLLGELKVGVIGCGGVGMILVGLLARLGVGWLVVVDPERVELSNLSRLPEATRLDAMAWLTGERRPGWARALGRRLARPKVRVAARIARRAPASIRFDAIRGDVADAHVARRLRDCDVLLLAADSQQARVVFNALVHQFLIPGIQIGSKIELRADGQIGDVFSVLRPVRPTSGCLWCNGAINPTALAAEALTPRQRAAQRYLPQVVAPSVVTLNAIGAAQAANDLMLAVTGLTNDEGRHHRYDFVREHRLRRDRPRHDPACPDCGNGPASRLARGDSIELPCR
jgi:hypothetical protein